MSGVQSIERAFAVLRQLATGPAGVTEIAERTHLPKSTVSRLLSALERERVVQQHMSSADYVLGDGLAELAGAVGRNATMAGVVKPFLRELSEATGETVGFVVRDGREAYWVDNVEGADLDVHVTDRTGHRAPLHAVPAGLALLAHLPQPDIDEYLAVPLEPFNDRTICDEDELRQLLAEIRSAGVVWSTDLLGTGITAVDAPFRGPSGNYEGALFVNAPSYRFPKDGERANVEQLVVATAARLSERFVARASQ